jgi:negative regulator of flagellin synthesis FlgM
MKIDSPKSPESQGLSQGTQNIQKTQGQAPKDKAAEARKISPSDTVDISSRSKEIADIMSAVNQLPDVREGKVQKIKQSVDAGTYTVDPRKVAEKILKEI